MKTKYLISIIENGKCVRQDYSENMLEAFILRKLYKGCVLLVYDLRYCYYVPHQTIVEVERRLARAMKREVSALPVVCIERRKIYSSLAECARENALSKRSLKEGVECGLPVRGLHYVPASAFFPSVRLM